jgi:hypothetical protein
LKSLSYHAGIQYLESHLILSQRISENASKKKKNNKLVELIQKDEKIIWRELSRLYDALEEKDVLLGLAEKVSVYPLKTRNAIDAEVAGDFRKAVEVRRYKFEHMFLIILNDLKHINDLELS